MKSEQLITLTMLRFSSLRQRWWALGQMQKAHVPLAATEGLAFYKLLGSGGGNGFGILPDLSTYVLLTVWSSREAARHFFSQHAYYRSLTLQTTALCTIQLQAVKARGSWDKIQPFQVNPQVQTQGPLAVLTRATIHPSRLFSFWKNVPAVSRQLKKKQQGLLFSKGIGEVPLLQQATFSLWKDRKSMVDYAYRGRQHSEVIAKTSRLKWYKEELFAEFVPVGRAGDWPGISELTLPPLLSV